MTFADVSLSTPHKSAHKVSIKKFQEAFQSLSSEYKQAGK